MDDGPRHVRGWPVARSDLGVGWNLVAEEEVRPTTEMVGDHDVADPADDDAHREPGGRGVERDRDREALATKVCEAENQTADESPKHRQSALPDGQHVSPRVEGVEVSEDVEPAGAEDRAQRTPRDRVVDLRAWDATRLGPPGHEVGSGEEAERRSQAVG